VVPPSDGLAPAAQSTGSQVQLSGSALQNLQGNKNS